MELELEVCDYKNLFEYALLELYAFIIIYALLELFIEIRILCALLELQYDLVKVKLLNCTSMAIFFWK